MSSANIILNAFESTFTLDLSGVLQIMDPLPTIDVSANATIHVDLGMMRDIFTYHTDSADVVNAAETDLKFYVNSDSTAGTGFASTSLAGTSGVNPANGLVDLNPIYNETDGSKRMVCHDFVRYLASSLFGTHFGVDLFENEQELLDHLRSLSNNATGHVWANINAVADAVNTEQQYSTLDANICCAVYRQMITQFPDRFANIAADCLDSPPTPTSQYHIPFLEGDTIQFKLSISPAAGQEALTGVSAFGARTYSITLLCKETANIANPAVVDDPDGYSWSV